MRKKIVQFIHKYIWVTGIYIGLQDLSLKVFLRIQSRRLEVQRGKYRCILVGSQILDISGIWIGVIGQVGGWWA